MSLHNFTTNPIIERSPPNSVVYDLSSFSQTTITLPIGSSWTSGLHWHETHVEYLQVIKGRVKVQIGDEIQIITAGVCKDELVEVKIATGVRHEWGRADGGEGDEEDVVVIERTEPADGEKTLFFWNLNGVILNAGNQNRNIKHSEIPGITWIKTWWSEVNVALRLFIIFRALDNFPVIFDLSGPSRIASFGVSRHMTRNIEWLGTHLTLGFAGVIGKIFGIRAVDIRYTPATLFGEYMSKLDRLKEL